MKDLFVLVADGNMRSGIKSLLDRKESLGIRQISYSIGVHKNSDPKEILQKWFPKRED